MLSDEAEVFYGGYVIYALVDPRNGAVRYIGLSINHRQRLAGHLGRPRNRRLSLWLHKLRAVEKKPRMAIIGFAEDEEEAKEEEHRWIVLYRRSGADLVNA